MMLSRGLTESAKTCYQCCHLLLRVCGDAQNPVDIELVKQNAIAQGIELQSIAIQYVGLSDEDKDILRSLNLLKYESGNNVIATFTESGDALFPKKIIGVHYLAAD